MSAASNGELAAGWLRAAGDGCVSAALEGVYAALEREIAERRPVCRASGRCCNFEAWGHRLYVTGLETAHLVRRLPVVGGGRSGAHSADETGGAVGLRVLNCEAEADTGSLTPESIAAAEARGGCPFQAGRLCGVHAIRPLGCRVYFCDETSTQWQREAHERLLREVREIHDAHGIVYRYGEWRGMLRMFAREGIEASRHEGAE